jgi:hypothetical protein
MTDVQLWPIFIVWDIFDIEQVGITWLQMLWRSFDDGELVLQVFGECRYLASWFGSVGLLRFGLVKRLAR